MQMAGMLGETDASFAGLNDAVWLIAAGVGADASWLLFGA